MNDKKNYTGVDIVKFIMAVFVIAIHTQPLYSMRDTGYFHLYEIIISTAVPYFFMASGYFLFTKINNDDQTLDDKLVKLRQYILKLIKLYLIWTVIYMPITLYDYC